MENSLEHLPLAMSSIDGVFKAELPTHSDDRGSLTVLGNEQWSLLEARQWNLSISTANVMRGLHAHKTHSDWLICVSGVLSIGLFDLRPSSSTFGQSELLALTPLNAVFIPVGVGHGFHNLHPTVHAYATSRPWTGDDEYGCRFDDPKLNINWGIEGELKLSRRDQYAGTLEALLQEFSS